MQQPTNRIQDLFQRKSGGILNIYFTAGHPDPKDFPATLSALEAAGVDFIEIGMPYSDPLADGPTIQESGAVALRKGTTLPWLFDQIKAIRAQIHTPLILMGYFNQVMQYGEARFFEKCQEAGVDGLILPDLPLLEYEKHYKDLVEQAGLAISFLITPQTPEERIRKIDELTRGFIYMVSDSSITGAKAGISDKQIAYFERINGMGLRNPRLIGFGISTREGYDTACRYAQGAIIGSAFIKALEQGGEVKQATSEFIGQIRP
ncbi:MAG: tryptophan synthase subunit alpha [Haliscomenobacter sp.]|nr:tryptophan synthase subunit alpha [Haliscomenobacter sp.]